MKKKKIFIFISILVIIYLLLLWFALFKNNKTSEKKVANPKYMIFDDFINLEYSKNNWKVVSAKTVENKNKKFKVFNDDNYMGEYILKYGNTWNLFDDNYSYVTYEGDLYAYSTDFNVQINDYPARTLNKEDKAIIKKTFGYSYYDDYNINNVIELDIDNNGVMDEIVCVSNIGFDTKKINKYYNLVFIKFNNKVISLINENNSDRNMKDAGIYKINRLFSIDQDNYLVISKIDNYISEDPTEEIILYQYNNKAKFNKIEYN